jgi:hypothetical protein
VTFDPQVLPLDFRAHTFDKFTDDERAKWISVRERGMFDAMFLATKILGWDFQPTPHAKLFSEFLQITPGTLLFNLDKLVKKRMILWPRGVFKTTAAAVVAVQLIINYPDIRILIMEGSVQLAKRQLARIKKIFEQHAKFRYFYPESCSETKLGDQEEFSIPNQSAERPYAEPTCAISTAKSVKAGSHFDVIFVDDLVNEQNYKSVKALEKCWEQYKEIGPLLEPSGYLFVTGTRYSFGDTYERISEAAAAEMRNRGATVWHISVRTCWVQWCATCNHADTVHNKDLNYQHPPCTSCDCQSFVDSGKRDLLFPEATLKDGRTVGHTVAYLESEKAEKGDEFFSCQYCNNPIASSEQVFTPELLGRQTLYHVNQLPSPQVAPCFLVGDLSYAGEDKRDKSVIYVCYLNQGQIYVSHCISGKWNTEEVTLTLFTATMKFRPRVIFLEKFLGAEAYDTFFRAFALDKGIQRFPVEWVQMSNTADAKRTRIRSIQGPLSKGRLWLFAGMDEFETLRTQLLRFPKLGKHDDYADALGLVVGVPSGYQLTQAEVRPKLPKWLELPEEEVKESEPDGGCGTGILC